MDARLYTRFITVVALLALAASISGLACRGRGSEGASANLGHRASHGERAAR
jgi:hypothetical protein